jgi:hypothetical protein
MVGWPSGAVAPGVRRGAPRRWLAAALAAGAAMGCYTVSGSYRPALEAGDAGYRDEWIGPDRFKVVATGEKSVPIEVVCGVAMLRAAYLTLEHGRDHFVVTNKHAGMEDVGLTRLDAVPVNLPGIGPLLVPVGTVPDPRPVCELSIRLAGLWTPPPRDAIDAHRVVEQLGPAPKE